MSQSSSQQTFGEVFGNALRQRGMSLSNLRDRLAGRGHQVSLATLSYWRSGQREPERLASLEALPLIEELLRLPDGALVGKVGRQRRGRVKAFNELLDVPVEHSMRSEMELSRVASHLTVDLNADGDLDHMRHRWVVVAERDDVAGMTLFLRAESLHDLLLVTAVAGCTIELVNEAGEGAWSYFARFDRPLQVGESTVFEVEIRLTEAEAETDYGLIVEERLEDAIIWVRFHPDKVPARCWVHLTEGDVKYQWPFELGSGNTVHQRQTAFGPGRLGVRWEWDV